MSSFASNDTVAGADTTSSGSEFHWLTILVRRLYFLTSSLDLFCVILND